MRNASRSDMPCLARVQAFIPQCKGMLCPPFTFICRDVPYWFNVGDSSEHDTLVDLFEDSVAVPHKGYGFISKSVLATRSPPLVTRVESA